MPRSQAIEEARREMRTRAGRAEAEADALRHELAGLRTAAETSAAETQASGKDDATADPGLTWGARGPPGEAARWGVPMSSPATPVPSPETVIRHGDPSRGRPDL